MMKEGGVKNKKLRGAGCSNSPCGLKEQEGTSKKLVNNEKVVENWGMLHFVEEQEMGSGSDCDF